MLAHPAGNALILIVAASTFVFLGYCWARICAKAGFPAWWGILMMLPGVNLIPFLYLAFAPWPVHKDMHR